jgi:hypothetical protein
MRSLGKIAAVMFVFSVAYCGGGESHVNYYTADQFVDTINRKLPYTADLVKTYSHRDGWIVIYDTDFGYRAVNLQGVLDAGYSASEAADLYLDEVLFDLDLDRLVSPIGYGDYIDDYGYIYEESSLQPKDLLSLQAILEEVNAKRLGEQLALEFGLSETQGLRVAKLARNWEKISNTRAMTDADLNALTSDLFGIDLNRMKTAEAAAQQGNLEMFNNLIDEAATSLETTPENFRSIINKLSAE